MHKIKWMELGLKLFLFLNMIIYSLLILAGVSSFLPDNGWKVTLSMQAMVITIVAPQYFAIAMKKIATYDLKIRAKAILVLYMFALPLFFCFLVLVLSGFRAIQELQGGLPDLLGIPLTIYLGILFVVVARRQCRALD